MSNHKFLGSFFTSPESSSNRDGSNKDLEL